MLDDEHTVGRRHERHAGNDAGAPGAPELAHEQIGRVATHRVEGEGGDIDDEDGVVGHPVQRCEENGQPKDVLGVGEGQALGIEDVGVEQAQGLVEKGMGVPREDVGVLQGVREVAGYARGEVTHHWPGDDRGNNEEDAEHRQLRAEPPEDLDRDDPERRETLGPGRRRLGLGRFRLGCVGGQERTARIRAFCS